MEVNSSTEDTKLCFWFNMTYYINKMGVNDTGLYDFSPRELTILTLAYAIISVLAVIGNSLVIWMVVCSSRLQESVNNYFVANLAFVDLVMGIFVVPLQIHVVLRIDWPQYLPHSVCPLMLFVRDLTINVAVFTLVVIAFLRWHAVTDPIRAFADPLSLALAKRVISCIWVLATIVAVLTFRACEVCYYFDDKTDKRKFFCNEWKALMRDNLQNYLPLWIAQYIAPVCAMSYLHCCAAKVLRSSPVLSVGGEENNKNSARTMVIVTVAFCFCWFFVQTYRLLRMFNVEVDRLVYANVYWFTFNWLAMSNSCYNPFIYALSSTNFRDELKRRFWFCGKWINLDQKNASII